MLTAQFSFIPTTTDLSVQFTDRSIGSIASRAWTFGFTGGTNTSTAETPLIAFPTAGIFKVSLEITGSGGDSGTSTARKEILIYRRATPLVSFTIEQMIKNILPKDFEYNYDFQIQAIQMWQDYIFSLENEKNSPLDAQYIYDQSRYTPSVNTLIANLVIFDLMVNSAQLQLMSGKGQVKRMETGPSNAEWHNIGDFWNTVFKNGGYDAFTKNLCLMARTLRISLPMCPKLKTTTIFQVVKNLPIK